MLSFFRKHEKAFFLIFVAPSVVALGITGVVSQLNKSSGPQVIGKLFGEEIDSDEFQQITQAYQKWKGGRGDGRDDSEWRFSACVRYAERNGLRVGEGELGKKVKDEVGQSLRFQRAQQELQKRGIRADTPEGQRQLEGELNRQLNLGDALNKADYEKFVQERYHLSIPEDQGLQQRLLLEQKLFDAFGLAGTVSPEEVWRDFDQNHHKRFAEILELQAKDHRPTAEAVTDDELERFHAASAERYHEPRRVDLELVAAPFDKVRAEVSAPTDTEMQGFYDKRKDDLYKNTAPVGSPTTTITYRPLADVKDDVREKIQDQKTRERAMGLIEKVKARLDAQEKAKKAFDLKGAASEVGAAEKSQAIVQASTGLVELAAVESHPIIASLPALRHFREKAAGSVSSELASDKAVFVLFSREVKPQKTPTFEELKAQLKKDFVDPSERELRERYNRNQEKYRADESFTIDAAFTELAMVAKHRATAPKEGELDAYLKEHATRWPGKKLDEVKSDVETAFRTARAPEESRKALQQLLQLAREAADKNRPVDLDVLKIDPKVPSFLCFESVKMIEREKLKDHAILGGAASAIVAAPVGRTSDSVFERGDGQGQVVFFLKEHRNAAVKPFEEVKGKVRDDVLDERGTTRARSAAESLVRALADLRADALVKALADRKLKTRRTPAFTREATSVEGVPPSVMARVASETFLAEAGGTFERIVDDPSAGTVYVVRCAEKEAPDGKLFPSERTNIRARLTTQAQLEAKERCVMQLLLDAKGVSKGHVKYVRDRRLNDVGEHTVKVRQVFVGPDKKTIQDWIEAEAQKVLKTAEGALAAGSSFEDVVSRFSEDTSGRAIGGLRSRQARGEAFQREHGAELEDQLFRLTPQDGVTRLKSKLGWHLVKVESIDTMQGPHGRKALVTYRQVLVKCDAETRRLPAEKRDEAEKKARGKIEAAKKRIDAGEPFATVAHEVGETEIDLSAETPLFGKGEPFDADWTSPFVRAAIEQPVETVSDPVEVKDASGSLWQLFACARDPNDQEPAFKARPRGPRIVHHIAVKTKEEAERIKRELDDRVKATGQERAAPWHEVLKHFAVLARKHSVAETAPKGGTFGQVQVGPAVRELGTVFLERVAETKDGSRTDVFRGATGLHLVMVVKREDPKQYDIFRREQMVLYTILGGTDWN